MERCSDLLHLVMGCGHSQKIRVQRLSSLTAHVPISTGFSNGIGSNLGTNATLQEVLQMLDEHYGVVMTFNVLNKEL